MSEYTEFIAVQSPDVATVVSKLSDHRIMAFVDPFDYPGEPFQLYKDAMKWIVVTVLNAHAKDVGSLFQKVVYLFEDEDWKSWKITCYWNGDRIWDKQFLEGHIDRVSEPELKAVAEFFGTSAKPLKLFLTYSSGGSCMEKFCRAVHIPYAHMVASITMPSGEDYYSARGFAIDTRTLRG
jgi:hypothetical protein